MLTDNECTEIINKLARRNYVRPSLVMTNLLSPEDLEDLKNGDVAIDALDLHIQVWKENGCENKQKSP